MPDNKLLELYKEKKLELQKLTEEFNSGDFLNHIVPEEFHFLVKTSLQETRDAIETATREVDSIFAKIKSDLVQEAVAKFESSGQFDRRNIEGIKVTARQSISYNMDKLIAIAKEKNLLDKLARAGVITTKTILDEKKFAMVVSQDEQALFSAAKEVRLKDVSVVDKTKGQPQDANE
jgi:hypothetical protein